MPLGAVAMCEKVASYFTKNVFYGGLTYSAHPMCVAAAVANLEIMHQDDIVGNAKRQGAVMSRLLNSLKQKHPCVGDVRNIGLLGCIELVKSRKTKGSIDHKSLYFFFPLHIFPFNFRGAGPIHWI